MIVAAGDETITMREAVVVMGVGVGVGLNGAGEDFILTAGGRWRLCGTSQAFEAFELGE